MRLPQRSSKAFTLIELIVVIVILGILALIAIPTFGKVVAKSQDESTLSSLRAMARNAQALKAMDQASAWGTIPADSIGEVNVASSAGVQAARLAAIIDDGLKNPVAGQVSYKVTADNVVFSMLSGSKRICLVGATPTSIGQGKCVEAGKDATGGATTSSAAAVFSSDASVLPPSTATAQAPSIPASAAFNTVTSSGATITWTSSVANGSAVTGYTITAKPASGATVTATASANATSVALSGLSASTTYMVTIVADSAAGSSTAATTTLTTSAPEPGAAYAAAVMTSAPSAYYRFSATTGSTFTGKVPDASGNGMDATVVGTVTAATTPKTGTGASFSGTSGRLEVPAGFRATNGLSYEAVVIPSQVTSYGALFNFGEAWDSQVNAIGLQRLASNNTLYFSVNGFSPFVSSGNDTFKDLNVPVHVVATVDAVGNEAIYFNGVLMASAKVNAPGVASDRKVNLIGQDRYTSNPSRWAGIIDEAAIYSKALTASEVAAHYAALSK